MTFMMRWHRPKTDPSEYATERSDKPERAAADAAVIAAYIANGGTVKRFDADGLAVTHA